MAEEQVKKIDWLVCFFIYILALIMVMGYAFTHDYTSTSDSELEYNTYLYTVETGKLVSGLYIEKPRPELKYQNLLSSCLVTTAIPAYIQRFIGLNPLVVYKVWNCLLIGFFPVVVYVIARLFLSIGYSLIPPLFSMAQFRFIVAPDVARTTIAQMFFALMVLVILKNNLAMRYKITYLFGCSLGIVFSHYGTAFVSITILSLSIILLGLWYIIKKRRYHSLVSIGTGLVMLIVISIVWYGIATKVPMSYAKGFTTAQVNEVAQELKKKEVVQQGEQIQGIEDDKATQQSEQIDDSVVSYSNFFSLDRRDPVTQVAFGKTLSIMNIPQKIEFAFSWLSVLSVIFGMYVIFRQFPKIEVDYTFLFLSISGFIVLFVTLCLPYLSTGYGVSRVYSHILCFSSVLFCLGGQKLSKLLRLRSYVVPVFILLFFALSTTGIIHQIFGIDKWA